MATNHMTTEIEPFHETSKCVHELGYTSYIGLYLKQCFYSESTTNTILHQTSVILC
jgi:hypothetical protein